MDWAGNGWTKVSHAPPGEHHSDHQASNNATKQRGETSEQTYRYSNCCLFVRALKRFITHPIGVERLQRRKNIFIRRNNNLAREFGVPLIWPFKAADIPGLGDGGRDITPGLISPTNVNSRSRNREGWAMALWLWLFLLSMSYYIVYCIYQENEE